MATTTNALPTFTIENIGRVPEADQSSNAPSSATGVTVISLANEPDSPSLDGQAYPVWLVQYKLPKKIEAHIYNEEDPDEEPFHLRLRPNSGQRQHFFGIFGARRALERILGPQRLWLTDAGLQFRHTESRHRTLIPWRAIDRLKVSYDFRIFRLYLNRHQQLEEDDDETADHFHLAKASKIIVHLDTMEQLREMMTTLEHSGRLLPILREDVSFGKRFSGWLSRVLGLAVEGDFVAEYLINPPQEAKSAEQEAISKAEGSAIEVESDPLVEVELSSPDTFRSFRSTSPGGPLGEISSVGEYQRRKSIGSLGSDHAPFSEVVMPKLRRNSTEDLRLPSDMDLFSPRKPQQARGQEDCKAMAALEDDDRQTKSKYKIEIEILDSGLKSAADNSSTCAQVDSGYTDEALESR